jgi:serine phosphatase RsbU (regulator of sigma subunit)
VSRGLVTNLIALATVGILIALIGLVTLSASQLVNETVNDQFKSQELQLVGALAQQSEADFDSLNSDISGLALQPAVITASPRVREDALALLAEHAAMRPGVITSMVIFDHRGDPRYGWPETFQQTIDAEEQLPYSPPSTIVEQTRAGNYIQLDITLTGASHTGKPDGTFLLIAPILNDLRKTDLLVYELDLDALFNELLGVIKLDSRGQLWVINSIGEVLFQANDSIPINSLLDKLSLASVFSFRQAEATTYTVGNDERLGMIAPIRTRGDNLVIILSRETSAAVDRVESDLRQIFALSAGAVVIIAAMALIVLRYLSREAQRRQQEIQRRQTARTLLEISRALNSTLDLEDVLRRIMGELAGIVPYDSAAVLLLDRSKLAVAAHRGLDVSEHEVAEFDLDEAQAANQVIQTGRPLVIPDTLLDERWKTLSSGSAIRSWMGIPLRMRDKTVGVLNVNSHQVARYSPEQIELAEAFADQASVALQNARLHEVEVKQIEQELVIARDIQTSLLPSASPQIEQLEIAAYTLPARQVSGDYFQYLPMPNGQLGIAVGDVSGKGIPAALLMAVITTALRDEVARNARPSDLLSSLNVRLLERMKNTHVNSALLVGVFDPPTRHFEIANGGMVQPYVSSGEAWSFVPVGGYPLGLSQRLAYDSKTVTLAPGSLLLVVTDGVVEAQNTAGEMYGFERLEELLNSLPKTISAQGVIDAVMASVRAHLGDQEPQDDVTLLAIRSLEVAVPKIEMAGVPSETGQDEKTIPEPAPLKAEPEIGHEVTAEAPVSVASLESTKGD